MYGFRRVAIPILLAGIVPLLTGCAGGNENLKGGMRKSITTPAPPASPIVEKVPVKADAAPPDPKPANL